MSPVGPTNYAMYLRKSEMDLKWQKNNPDGEDPLARHERTLRRLAKADNGVVGETFADPDITASKEDVFRPEFERLLVDLPHFGGLLAMDIDRVTRNSPKLEALIKVYEANPHLRFLVADKVRSPDLGTPEGRNTARMMVIRANDEALQIARRMRDMHEDLRQQAKPHTGVSGFGTKRDGLHEDPIHAKMIRAAAVDILAGIKPWQVAKQWRAAGVKTPRGKDWSGHQVEAMLRSPRMAGYRVHKGERYKLEETGEWAMCGPVLLDEATWLAVVEVLDAVVEGKVPRRRNREYLLSGFASCGVCATLARGNVWADGKRYSYACSRGCVGIAGHRVDKYIEGLLLEHWAKAHAASIVEPTFAGAAERARLEELNRTLMAKLSAGDADAEDVMPTVAKNRADINRYKAEERKLVQQRARRATTATNPTERWHKLKAAGDLDRMRLMVEAEIADIVIQPSTTPGRRVFDKDRVRVRWV